MRFIKKLFGRLFKKKREYVIVTDMATNKDVQEFAKRIGVEGCELSVHVHGCLLEGDNLVTILFKTDVPETIVYSELIDTFQENYKLALRRTMIFVFQKKEEEES